MTTKTQQARTMGRRPEVGVSRYERIQVRLTRAERQQLETIAHEGGHRSLSSYMRARLIPLTEGGQDARVN